MTSHDYDHDPVFDLYSVVLTDTHTTALIVGYLRSHYQLPESGERVPLFDELTPYIVADSPYPLYALISHTDTFIRRSWRLVPATSHPGTPSMVRVDDADHTRATGTAVILGGNIHPALRLSGVHKPPFRFPVHA
ncbi:hypothetical protein [Nocardia sp. CA-120079]|uniref:hypothetical protein n=1 Tax=Nocardia sp. CA-120079 TaxID=3239974 RepID=UPI003D985A48